MVTAGPSGIPSDADDPSGIPSEFGTAGYFIATEVCAMLESRRDDLYECLRALKDGQDGQGRLQSGDARGALPLLRKAHDRFQRIPEARLLLGINKADLAAAYGNIGKYQESVDFAEDAIAIVAGDHRLNFTEATARLSLATSLGVLGRLTESDREFERAEALMRRMPQAGPLLRRLQANRAAIRDLGR